jgi:hypothetical protein
MAGRVFIVIWCVRSLNILDGTPCGWCRRVPNSVGLKEELGVIEVVH